MTSGDAWTPSQKTRVKILFEEYPELEKAYSIAHYLRIRFSNKNATWFSAKESIDEWYAMMDEFNNDAFNTVADTIKSRETEVLNRSTNAFAEFLNVF